MGDTAEGSPVPEYSGVLLPPAGREEKEEDEGAGPKDAIISITLGRTMWLGLSVRQRFRTGPSHSSLTWMSGFTGTGFQLHTGSMVISSYSELGGEGQLRLADAGANAAEANGCFLLLHVDEDSQHVLVHLQTFQKSRFTAHKPQVTHTHQAGVHVGRACDCHTCTQDTSRFLSHS